MEELKGKVAVVTGGASGIGRAIADRFAREGMKVVLADVEEAALAAAAAEIRAVGADVHAVRTDVSRPEQVDALANQTLEHFGAVHVVCNNAGVAGPGVPTWEHSIETWKWVFGVNLWGVIYGIRSFAPILVRQGEGHIVNTASIAGHVPFPFFSTYTATKFAVVGMSESLFYEFQMMNLPIGVSVVCPGFVRTGIADSDRNRPPDLADPAPPSEAERAMREQIRRFIATGTPPEQVAEAVIQAVRQNRFYVFPHPELLPVVQTRVGAILNQSNPALQMSSLMTPPE